MTASNTRVGLKEWGGRRRLGPRRRKLLESGERLMLADYLVVPLYFFSSLSRLMKPYVYGVVANPLNHIRSKHSSCSRDNTSERTQLVLRQVGVDGASV